MNIMVLDDSDDDTVEFLEKKFNDYKKQGFQIEHVRRGTKGVQSRCSEICNANYRLLNCCNI